jgi:hypothetical protein
MGFSKTRQSWCELAQKGGKVDELDQDLDQEQLYRIQIRHLPNLTLE